ncbi:phenylacetate--CoA ligase family protein [Stieleria varia]|uniref:Phenylacetate-coenzyme A ligase n=1 Tax=Stieleria varia TaxID=2528005 RepID=A0A5C6B815_9BACT|nr:AMP-binding protein [Stieleria varia]TWU08213.1 Phenylacetate-coenzyme A ligase [Stieleria varia]
MTSKDKHQDTIADLSQRSTWRLTRPEIETLQLDRLNNVLASVVNHPLYRERFSDVALPLQSLDDLSQIRPLNKSELVVDKPGEPGRLFALPRHHYSRMHQTSGTSGHPMPVLDTAQDWRWWTDCWQHVLDAAEVTDHDVAMMAFSFGPFIGFWTANDALVRRGAMVIPGGGISSETRLRMIIDHRCTIVCCTPTYALHLASMADQCGIDLPASDVRCLIVAGEPGGSIPAIRERMETAWGATVIDHAGASELGAWGFGTDDGAGLHVIETEFIGEVLRFDEASCDGVPVADGDAGELVLTGLGRMGGPAIRYRTGDIVHGVRDHNRECRFLFLPGGVHGRADDMIVVRGVNVFPSSIEAIVREIDGSVEYRALIDRIGEMDSMRLEAELSESQARELAELLQKRLAMRVDVTPVPLESLPRFQAKSRRWIDRRGGA